MNRTSLVAAAIALAALSGTALAADPAPAGIMEEVVVTAPYPARPALEEVIVTAPYPARPAMEEVAVTGPYPAEPVMEEVVVTAPYPLRPIMEEVIVRAERPPLAARRQLWLDWLAGAATGAAGDAGPVLR